MKGDVVFMREVHQDLSSDSSVLQNMLVIVEVVYTRDGMREYV